MAEYKDQRAVGDDFIQDLNNDEILGEFTQFVKNHQAEFQMCFRGNGENEKVIIYKNNHAFWTITKNKDKNNEVVITYFVPDNMKTGGKYIDKKGKVRKINIIENLMILEDKTEILINEIIDINGEMFNELY